ncbi:uncharacterized protein RBU33_005134 isoform 1-T1 [Hipposideros larvatus]
MGDPPVQILCEETPEVEAYRAAVLHPQCPDKAGRQSPVPTNPSCYQMWKWRPREGKSVESCPGVACVPGFGEFLGTNTERAPLLAASFIPCHLRRHGGKLHEDNDHVCLLTSVLQGPAQCLAQSSCW